MKRIVSLILALAMVLSMASFAAAEEATGIASWKAFDKTVTLQIPVYDRGYKVSVQENYWTKWVQANFGDKYNIQMQFIPITRSAVEADYDLLASRQALPAIMMEYDYPKVSRWANDGYLVPIDLEYFASVAPTYYAKMVENGHLGYTAIGGEDFFVMAERPYSATNVNFSTFVRMDWLEAVGYDHIPVGREEYKDAMLKIKAAGLAEYPGGGAAFSAQSGYQVYATRDLPMSELEWAMYGDFSVPAMGWEPAKEAVRRANEDYNLGITNPEYYVIDTTTAEANFYAGKTYSYGAYLAADMYLLNNFYAQNPDGKLAVYTEMADESVKLTNEADPIYRAENPMGMIIGFSSQATEEQHLAAMMYLEWMIQPENLFVMQYGVEGENHNVIDGVPTLVGEYNGEYAQGYNNNKDYWCCAIEARKTGTYYDTIASISPKGLPQDFTAELQKQYDLNLKKYELGYAMNDALFAQTIEAENEYRGTLQALFTEFYDKLVMCKPEEFDALYEQYTAEYMDAGYRDVIEQRKAAYEAGQTTKLRDNQK